VIVFTDLDGTLLDEDGRLSPEAREALDDLRRKRIPVVPLTSKTRRELEPWLAMLDSGRAGAFENGAGISFEGEDEILPGAVSTRDLRAVLDALRNETGLPLVSVEEIRDVEMMRLAGLSPAEAAVAREREYDLPFVAPADDAELLAGARLSRADVRLVRGGRFFHLSGRHDKADAMRALLVRLGGGATFGLGDAPNDAGFLSAVDDAVLIPRASGLDAILAGLVPGALVAPAPAGEGWAAAVRRFVLGEGARA
jgi:mannosyl-3-phosphoglycerate phosphatase